MSSNHIRLFVPVILYGFYWLGSGGEGGNLRFSHSYMYNLLIRRVSLSLLLACTLSALKLSVMSKEGLLRVSKTAPFKCLENRNQKNITVQFL